jgi:integrase
MTFHSLRHSMASNAYAAGVPDRLIQAMGNWKDARMLERYRHLADDQLREASGTIAGRIAGSHNTVTPHRKRAHKTKASTKKAANC